jgi:diguanylate cyclase (GGDEF)-like protein/PAS domain S-box-containing protein
VVVVLDPQLTPSHPAVGQLVAHGADPGWDGLWSASTRLEVLEARDLDQMRRLTRTAAVVAVIVLLAPADRRVDRRVRALRAIVADVPLLVVGDGVARRRADLVGWGADDVLERRALGAELLPSLATEVRRARRHDLARRESAHLLAAALFAESGYALLDGMGTVALVARRSTEPWSARLIGLRAADLVVGADAARFEGARRLAGRSPSSPCTVEVEVVSPTPGRRWLEITLVDVGEASMMDGVVATHRDVTVRHVGGGGDGSTVIECLAEGVVVYGPDGIVTAWNESAGRLLGVPAVEAVGARVELLIGQVPPQGAGAGGPRTWTDEVVVVRPGGFDQVIERRFTRLRGGHGVLGETVLVVSPATERQATEAITRRFAAILDSSSEAIVCTTILGVITTWNAAAERMYGYSADEVVGRHVGMLVSEDYRAELDSILARVAAGLSVERLETVHRKDASESVVLLGASPLCDRDGTVVGAISVARDITELRAAEAERELAELRFDGAFKRSTFGMAMSDLLGRLTNVNPAMADLLGVPPHQLVGRQLSDFAFSEARPLHDGGLPSVHEGADSYSDERRYRRPDGVIVWLQANVSLVRGPDEEPLYLMVQALDISSRKQVEYELEHRALHDDLTGLPNRALLNDRLDQALAVARRASNQVGVVFLDVDGFKHVNDALGHGTGDSLLVELGQRLCAAVRPDDTVARFGGDEFVILCADVDVGSMEVLARRIRASVAERFAVGGHDVEVHGSLGITVSAPESTVQSLLSEADAAMFRAKELGRNQVAVFDETLRAKAAEFLKGEKALRVAIARRDLVAYYQPIIDLDADRPIGVEALVRWIRSDGSVVAPGQFIPMAETTGLIVRLGELVLLQSAETVAAWNAGVGEDEQLWVSVNLSARQLVEPTLVDTVRAALDTSGLRPDLLHLEITETVMMGDVDASIARLGQIRTLGVHLAMDDFGTGYSSLAYLKQLPVDTLKIDHSFVDGVVSDPDDRTIVEAVIGLGRALGLTCLAEGVETHEQLEALMHLGCELGQGYLWARPMPADDARAWLTQQWAGAGAGGPA